MFVTGCSGCVQFLVIMSKAASGFVRTHAILSLGSMPKRGVAGSHGKCCLTL